MKISALIVARNEETKIRNTLESLSFTDEIIVILDRSNDGTLKICKAYTSKIFKGSWLSEGERRNFGIKKCNYDWILEVDADEIISKSLAKEIKSNLRNNSINDFHYIKLLNYVGEKPIKFGWMACLAPDGKFCLFRKKSKLWIDGRVHPQYRLDGRKGIGLSNKITHKMSRNISDLLVRLDRNSTLNAYDLKDNKTSLSRMYSIRRIFSRFIKCFILRKGYKSGEIGLLISILSAIYPFISAMKVENDIS
jgi:glycosyltransferase involved in cell wall biosynthesis